MSMICPNGHSSSATDYCDTCGAQIDAAAQSSAPGPASGAAASPAEPSGPQPQSCPNCHTDSSHDSLFCEACGYDFTTGAMPRGYPTPGTEAAAGEPEAPTGEPGAEPGADVGGSPGSPDGAAEGLAPEAPVGAAGIPPAVPVEWVAEVWIDPEWYAVQEAEEPMPSPGLPVVVPLAVRSALIGRVSPSKNITPDIDCTQDSGVSRRHAQLTTDGTRWFVEDLGSSNGTFVGPSAGPLPDDPIEAGPKRELADDERIYVGAWTRIVVRRATPEEIEAATA